MYVRLARVRDVKKNAEIQKRNSIKYPYCIGRFEECEGLLPTQRCDSCRNCPYDDGSYKKLNGGMSTMSDENVETVPKVEKTEEERKAERNAKYEGWIAKGWTNLTAGQKACARRMKDAGEEVFKDFVMPDPVAKKKAVEKPAETTDAPAA